MKKFTALVFCGLLLFCFLLSGCKEMEKEISTTYWQAVGITPVNSGQTPTVWKLEIKDAKTMINIDQELSNQMLGLLKSHPDYHIASSNINCEIVVTIAPNNPNEREK